MRRLSLVIPILTVALAACSSDTPLKGHDLARGLYPSPSSTPLESTPTPVPTNTVVPEKLVQPNYEAIGSLNAVQVSYPRLGFESIPVKGYSQFAPDEDSVFTQYVLGCRPFSSSNGQFIPDMSVQPNCIALLAHNHLSIGHHLEREVMEQDSVFVANDFGQVLHFKVSNVLRYRAVPPISNFQKFVDLESGAVFDTITIFNYLYHNELDIPYLVMQTCIENDGDFSWGRQFVVAEFVEVVE
ncbi:MAG TPA: hypothetical protein PLV59_00225 [Candidatus Dojkabacteria bacterium]|nr:hypothetical protein [Candidatus Dojkabacteria bacterium]